MGLLGRHNLLLTSYAFPDFLIGFQIESSFSIWAAVQNSFSVFWRTFAKKMFSFGVFFSRKFVPSLFAHVGQLVYFQHLRDLIVYFGLYISVVQNCFMTE